METANLDIRAAYEAEEGWLDLVRSWYQIVDRETDYGYIENSLTNSVFAQHSFEWAHYGYSRKDHSSISKWWDLNADNAILIKYTIRQYDEADGPSADIHSFLMDKLGERGYNCLGTTSDDEMGSHLTYWFLMEFCEPTPNPNLTDEDYEDDEPYDRWDDPYGDEDEY